MSILRPARPDAGAIDLLASSEDRLQERGRLDLDEGVGSRRFRPGDFFFFAELLVFIVEMQ